MQSLLEGSRFVSVFTSVFLLELFLKLMIFSGGFCSLVLLVLFVLRYKSGYEWGFVAQKGSTFSCVQLFLWICLPSEINQYVAT